jgi:DNA-binding response OmpR family regulator
MHAKCRVLILDDLADNADTLGEVMRLEGHDVRVCYCAADALSAATIFKPDACILDIGLPESDGSGSASVARDLRAGACTYCPVRTCLGPRHRGGSLGWVRLLPAKAVRHE